MAQSKNRSCRLRLKKENFITELAQKTEDIEIGLVANIAGEMFIGNLKISDFTISDIAYETGFNDPSYFARLFKNKMGVSPSTFQEKYRMNQKS